MHNKQVSIYFENEKSSKKNHTMKLKRISQLYYFAQYEKTNETLKSRMKNMLSFLQCIYLVQKNSLQQNLNKKTKHYRQIMGILLSKHHESLQKAKIIRNDLYKRIYFRKQKYQQIFSTIDNAKKKAILLSDATHLTSLMDSGHCSSVEIMFCFIQRTINVGIPNNYVIDQLFEEAIIKAMQCDSIRANNPNMKCWKYGMNKSQCFPPFFGVPCSVKQTVLMKGKQSYGGFVSKINPIPKDDTAYFQLIIGMGLIPFVRSNVPQACKTIETNNNIFGYCLNQRNVNRSCGGSSGGEGGLVGSYCSPFGIGSDIGGSLRVPAQFNGLFTLKPSRRNDRQANAYYGKFCAGSPVVGEPGPLVHSTQDLITYCDFMFDQTNYQNINPKKIDPHLTLNTCNHSIWQQKPRLKIGIIKKLDTLRCSKSHQNAVSKVAQILNNLGHQTTQSSLPNFEQFYFFMVKLFICNTNISVLDEIRQNQPFIKEYNLLHLLSKIPWILKRVLVWLLKKKQPRLAKILSLSKPMNCKEVMESVYEIQVKKAKQVLNYFIDNQFDALIMPGFAVPSPKLGQVAGLQYCLAFQTGWNVIQYPAGNIPVKLVERDETLNFEDQFKDVFTKNMRNSIKDSEGMPVGVQVISLPKNEQKILYIMSQLQQQIKFNEKYGLPLKI